MHVILRSLHVYADEISMPITKNVEENNSSLTEIEVWILQRIQRLDWRKKYFLNETGLMKKILNRNWIDG